MPASGFDDTQQTELSDIPVGDSNQGGGTAEEMNRPAKGFMVGGDGDVEVVGLDGNTVTLPGCVTGVQYWIGFKRISTTNTTATGVIALH